MYILNPLICVCRIAELILKPEGTKLSFSDSTIKLQLPGDHQWVLRKYNGDSRKDIAVIYNFVVKYIKWYIVGKDKLNMSPSMSEALDIIAKSAIEGFNKLKQSKDYEGDTTVQLNIQLMINHLRDALDGKFDEKHICNTTTKGDHFLEKELASLEDKIKTNFDEGIIITIANGLINPSKTSEEKIADLLTLLDKEHVKAIGPVRISQ